MPEDRNSRFETGTFDSACLGSSGRGFHNLAQQRSVQPCIGNSMKDSESEELIRLTDLSCRPAGTSFCISCSQLMLPDSCALERLNLEEIKA